MTNRTKKMRGADAQITVPVSVTLKISIDGKPVVGFFAPYPHRIGNLELLYDGKSVTIRHHGLQYQAATIDAMDLLEVARYLIEAAEENRKP